MKSEKLFKKIGVILNELQDQYDYLMENQGHCNELEYSLFQANADFLADHAKILYQFKQEELGKIIDQTGDIIVPNSKPSSSAPEVIKEQTVRQDRLQQDELQQDATKQDATQHNATVPAFEFNLSKSLSQEPVNEQFEFESKTVDELFDRPLSQEEEQILANKFYTEEPPAPKPLPVVSDEELGPEPFLIQKEEVNLETTSAPLTQTSLASKTEVSVESSLKEEVKNPSLNELFHAKLEQKNEDSKPEKKISDLKQGINLNDKLLYIKDLFNGYNLAYSEAIEVANKLPDFQAADNFFQKNYASQYNWNEKPVTASKFYELLRSRF